MFSGAIPLMNGTWSEDFEVSLDEAKVVVAEPGSNLSDFGPSTLYFESRILAHIIATTLIPRKVALNSLSSRDVIVLYCLLKRILEASLVDLSDYTPVEVSSTYNACAVGNMGYVLTDDKWSKKGFIKAKVD
ncbi:hypothetical protein H5410_042625 [Solanum commersonii]|uniref:Uncharacterized protein n=1 Tax=Solanum commersonii TaxID=4109 RepID=A0A9J5XWW9_SOLCO|nr:hypothetical protein H5410_042625 [Solanum commersonii]